MTATLTSRMLTPILQKWIRGLCWGALGFATLGQALDSYFNAVLIPFRARVATTAVLMVAWALGERWLRLRPIPWRATSGEITTVTSLGVAQRAALVGAILLVWLPVAIGNSVRWEWLSRLPVADSKRFTVAILRLENDDDEYSYQNKIAKAVRDGGMEALRLPRTISTDETDEEGHRRARAYLHDTGASIAIWGEVLRHDGRSVPRLYLTPSLDFTAASRGRYPLQSSDLTLPTVFWQDLEGLVGLLVSAYSAEFEGREGDYLVQRVRPLIEKLRSLRAVQWYQGAEIKSYVQSTLARWLTVVGDQSGDVVLLDEAVAAYSEAAAGYSRLSQQLNWAAAQTGRGMALQLSGDKRDKTEELLEAIEAHRLSLRVFTRESTPLDWARVQTNMGAALSQLAELEGDGRSVTLSMQAVAAHREALKEFTRDRAPMDWAIAQIGLASALRTMGPDGNEAARLAEATGALRGALEVITEERAPRHWAGAQLNLGVNLAVLGQREAGTARFEESIAAFRRALRQFTRERWPLDWAMTQSDLGRA